MKRNEHAAAREVIALGTAKDISDEQQIRLQAHLRECPECRAYAEAANGAARALRSQPLQVDPASVRRAQLRVEARARELQQEQERVWLVTFSCVFVGLSAAIGTPLLWWMCGWVGVWLGASSVIWQAGFSFFWITPVFAVAALLMARGTHLVSN